MKKVFLFIALCTLAFQFLYSQPKRYLDEVFSGVNVESNVKYGQNFNYLNEQTDLLLDVYTPAGDNSTKRPLIVEIHGGSFISGDKATDYVTYYSIKFAKHGYVTASINYRLGVEGYTLNAFGRAVFRAIQDAKAAVRYFRANAAKYGIDTSKIFLGGYSAGAVTTVHFAYMTTAGISAVIDTAGLGPLDNSSGNSGYSSEVKAVMSHAGAIFDTAWIKTGGMPIISFHGNIDNVVPYGDGYALSLIHVYGSEVIDRVAKRVGIKSEFYPFDNVGHTLPTDSVIPSIILDSIVNSTSRFLYEFLSPADVAEVYTYKEEFSVYPNPIENQGFVNINLLENESVNLEVYDCIGNKVSGIYSGELPAGLNTIPLNKAKLNLSKGLYFIRLNYGLKYIVKMVWIN